MAMTETQRTTLYNELSGAIGQEAARTLMEQLPPSGWDQVATKEDVKASERMLLREVRAGEATVLGKLRETEGQLLMQIAESESRQGARIEETNTRLDGMNTRIDARLDRTDSRIDETNRKLSALEGEVRDGFAELKLALARHTLWMSVAIVGVAASLAVPLMISVL